MKEQQVKIILRHLKKRSITSLEAINLYKITRAASRIFDLKQLGYSFVKKRLAKDNGFVRYYLVK